VFRRPISPRALGHRLERRLLPSVRLAISDDARHTSTIEGSKPCDPRLLQLLDTPCSGRAS